jgi:hypothetical protein
MENINKLISMLTEYLTVNYSAFEITISQMLENMIIYDTGIEKPPKLSVGIFTDGWANETDIIAIYQINDEFFFNKGLKKVEFPGYRNMTIVIHLQNKKRVRAVFFYPFINTDNNIISDLMRDVQNKVDELFNDVE